MPERRHFPPCVFPTHQIYGLIDSSAFLYPTPLYTPNKKKPSDLRLHPSNVTFSSFYLFLFRPHFSLMLEFPFLHFTVFTVSFSFAMAVPSFPLSYTRKRSLVHINLSQVSFHSPARARMEKK